jgi:hypothetical protein
MRCLDTAGYPWPGFIDTIVPASAVTALYIATGRHRQMNPPVFPVVAAKAGVSLDILLSGAALCHGPLLAETKKAKEIALLGLQLSGQPVIFVYLEFNALNLRQCLLQIRNDIVHVLDADRQPDKIGGYARG